MEPLASEYFEWEEHALRMLLDGPFEDLGILREQFHSSRPIRREFTGMGVYTDLYVPADSPRISKDHCVLSDVSADTRDDTLFFNVFIRDGRLSVLEAASLEGWPANIDIVNWTYDGLLCPERDWEKLRVRLRG